MDNKESKILVINGSYRDDGITDQMTDIAVGLLKSSGVEVEAVCLREFPIEFCLNCRECTQIPGAAPGQCVQKDAMQELVDKIEQSSGFVLAVPTNFGSVTAIFKRFMERLIVYAYWPWAAKYPKFRKDGLPRKKALIISSCSAPGIFGRLFYSSSKQLKMTAHVMGADCVGTFFAGLVGQEPAQKLSNKAHNRIESLVTKLL